MTDFDPFASAADATVPSPLGVDAALAALVARDGPVLFFDPDGLARELESAAPSSPFEIALVMTALAHEVPQRLVAAHDARSLNEREPALVEHLVRRAALDRHDAVWAVRAWADAVGVSATPAPSVESGTPAVFRTRGRGMSPATDAPDRSSADFLQPDLGEATIVGTPPTAIVEPLPSNDVVEPVAADAIFAAMIERHDLDDAYDRRTSRWSVAVPIAAIALVVVMAAVFYGVIRPEGAASSAVASTAATDRPPATKPSRIAEPEAAAATTPPAPTAPDGPASTPAIADATPPTPSAPASDEAPSAASVTAPPSPAVATVRDDAPRARSERIARAAPPTPRASLPVALAVPSDTCTRTTCGTVVDVRALDGDSAFVTTIRTDDGVTRAVVEGTRYAVGTAVRKRGEQFVPIRIGG